MARTVATVAKVVASVRHTSRGGVRGRDGIMPFTLAVARYSSVNGRPDVALRCTALAPFEINRMANVARTPGSRSPGTANSVEQDRGQRTVCAAGARGSGHRLRKSWARNRESDVRRSVRLLHELRHDMADHAAGASVGHPGAPARNTLIRVQIEPDVPVPGRRFKAAVWTASSPCRGCGGAFVFVAHSCLHFSGLTASRPGL